MQNKRIHKHDRPVCPIVWIRETPAYTDVALLLDAFLNKQTSTYDILSEVLHQSKAYTTSLQRKTKNNLKGLGSHTH